MDHVMITAGAVQAVYNVLAMSIECSSDVVLCPLPAYGLYKHQTELLGGTFVPVETQSGHHDDSDDSDDGDVYIPTVNDLRQVFNRYNNGGQQIKSIVLCYPNNPVGSCLTAHQAQQLAQFLDEQLEVTNNGFSIILDEVYFGILNLASHSDATSDRLIPHVSILQYASERVLRNSFLILSASKGLGSMPGMRCGLVCCLDEQMIRHMTNIQMACSANACIVSQIGLQASLTHVMNHPRESMLQHVSQHYGERTRYTVHRLNQLCAKHRLPDVDTATTRSVPRVAREPSATFYVFANFSSLLPDECGISTDEQIQQFFRDMYLHGSLKTGVACVPGVAFGMDPRQKLIRFSCAVDMKDLETAMDIIEEAVELILVKGVLKNKKE